MGAEQLTEESSTAKNLRAIRDAIIQHNGNCEYPATEVRMNPFEVERLDFDDILGVPIMADDDIGTGRFKIVCERDFLDTPGEVITEAVAAGAGATPEHA